MAHTPHFSIVDTYIRPTGICLRGIVTDATREHERAAIAAQTTKKKRGPHSHWAYSCCRSWRELVKHRVDAFAEGWKKPNAVY